MPVKRKRIGFKMPADPAGSYEVQDPDGDVIGIVTSGGYSPTLDAAWAWRCKQRMGGSEELLIQVRGN